MKHKLHKRFLLFSLALCSYIAVLCLLVKVESNDPNASINTIWQALWYSIVTLSTVGYGDLYPVTPIGKVIGLLFVFLSLGLLTFLLGSVVSALTGSTLPLLRLWLKRKKQWYVFSECNESTLSLARDLASTEPNCCLLFPKKDQRLLPSDLPCLCYPDTMAQIGKYKQDLCSLFFLSEESGSNYTQALEHLSLNFPIYCRTEHMQERMPDNLTLFNRYACCAREYWRHMPLQSKEKTIVLLGDGKYARQVLETGLLTNVFAPDHTTQYHVFGQWQDFLRNHPQLGLTIRLNEKDSCQDCVLFHEDAWNADEALLVQADRIILCSDDEKENLVILRQLRRYFAVTGSIHLRTDVAIPGELTFGTSEKIYTRELILRTQLTETARAMHQIYLDGTGATGPAWEDLTEFAQQSNLCAAEHLLVKMRLLLDDESICDITSSLCAQAYQVYTQTRTDRANIYRRIEHLRWMRFYSMYNWRYGPARNNELRYHPMLIPFDDLPPAEQAKDDYAWEMLGKLAEKD